MQFAKQIQKPIKKIDNGGVSNAGGNGGGSNNGGGGGGGGEEDECEGFMRRNDEYGMPYEKASKLQVGV